MSLISDYEAYRFCNKYKFDIVPQLSCFHNAFRATMHVFTVDKKLPQIYSINFPERNDAHAYLVYERRVYNRGITWPDNHYPDLSLKEVQNGKDYTELMLIHALRCLSGEGDDLDLNLVIRLAILQLPLYYKFAKDFRSESGQEVSREEYFNTCLIAALNRFGHS